MADVSRLEALRRRVEDDPASIAFAQLAEELRRAGQYPEAIKVCRTGLARHREYLSARVTLGRALIELNDLDAAQAELERVLRGAPENLAAIRGLAEIHHRRGDLPQALVHYRAAFALAPNDPELQNEIAALTQSGTETSGPGMRDDRQSTVDSRQSTAASVLTFPAVGPQARVADPEDGQPSTVQGSTPETLNSPERERAERTVAALEKWLKAIEHSGIG